jgi:hypothetical protein
MIVRVAHASRVLVAVSRRNSLFLQLRMEFMPASRKFAMARTPSPARETHALPDRCHAIFCRNRKAQNAKSRTDITMRTARFGQYSKKFAPRNMIARMSAMK